jgi:hypothetical protein
MRGLIAVGSGLVAGVALGWYIATPPLPEPPVVPGYVLDIREDLREIRKALDGGILTLPSRPHISLSPTLRGELQPEIARVLGLALVWSSRIGIGLDVNSLNDRRHRWGSLHYDNLAVDLDTEGDRTEDLRSLGEFLVLYLPLGYDIIVEYDHVHVEWEGVFY